MNEQETAAKPQKGGRLAVLAILAVIILLFAFFLKDIMIPLIRLETRHDLAGVQELLADKGLLGALSVILVEALQMVVVFIPAEFIQISTGLSYPLPIAILLCDLGVCLGATIIFALVRWFKVRSFAFEKRRSAIDRLSKTLRERNTVLLLYLLFFMPFIPFGAISYYGSSTKLPYRKYIFTIATGVIPSILVSNGMGAAGAAFLKNDLPLWILILILLVLAAALIALVLLFIKHFIFREGEGTPDSMMFAFLFFLAKLLYGKKSRLTIDDEILKGVETPYVVLFNHESPEDFYYASQIAYPKNPSLLANEYYMNKPLLGSAMKKAGVLSKKLFTRDSGTVMGILRTLRKGYPVMIFPEGRLSPDGRTNPIAESGAGLYKLLKTTLVLVNIEGAYYSHPKWRKRRYPSDVRLTVKRVLTPAELKEMPEAELEKVISDALYSNAADHMDTLYPQTDKAKGLEMLLYRCADCGALYQMEGVGNELVCHACGARHTLDEHYHFTSGPESIPAYYDAIKALEAPDLDRVDLHSSVRTKIFGKDRGPIRRENGECWLDNRSFRYRSGEKFFEIPVAELPALAYSCGEEFELYIDGELHYFYPTADRAQCARWGLLVDMMAEKRRAEMPANTSSQARPARERRARRREEAAADAAAETAAETPAPSEGANAHEEG
ncbi:MAG: VTT domain-containing protein [Lachnospiraceae bacterium]|nr:VTT domain-containing protein [Lachnospiraceae bacterium]